MKAKLLEGKILAGGIKEDLTKEIEGLKAKYGKAPKLCALQVGDNPSSAVYLKAQSNVSSKLGIDYEIKTLPAGIKEEEFFSVIRELNADDSVNGIIIQLPLPKGIDSKKAVSLLDPLKDAEGMHPANLGKVLLGDLSIAPCTAMASFKLIESTGIDIYGKEAVVIGHSDIVGKPIALMLLNKFATTTVCHIATGEKGLLPEHVKRAEVLVVAVGRAGIVKGEWVKEGAVVIDIGINKIGDKIVGDVEFDAASERASYITPVPGGVGPLTVTMLMKNTVEAFKLQRTKG
ncbi:MAG: bifunctional 5,10-methylene-tetrahydrofolate dehydrogenase/5,10-methylene-tetrahydrofolate cyclohydrolase [Candidatus Omnitrophica bacterium CG1_02_49_10]|nr:MAG: bifunctional 5,10-methylene-tetrahydrofolate dehydrogenase/5,10-methylene-tetrahydrofolate cyclohydrolase [Candidatus Omnitrophica bacterium CG1_02_49_10]